jgi:hypothetical protein
MAENKNILRRVFSGNALLGDALTKQGWYLIFLFVLACLYIWFHYSMSQTVKQVRVAEREVKNLQAIYAIKSSELMRMSKQSEVVRLLKERNVTTVSAPKMPPKRIKQ